MFKVIPIEAPSEEPRPRSSHSRISESPPVMPQDLLSRLTARGLRVLDSRRWLLVAAPEEAFQGAGWGEAEPLLRRWAASLQQQATMVAWARRDITPGELVERILDLPSQCLPVVVETLGGVEGLDRLSREPRTGADLDLCYAAYLQGLTHQVVQGLGLEDPDEPDGPEEPGEGQEGAGAEATGSRPERSRSGRGEAGESGGAARAARLPAGIRDLLEALALDPARPAEPEASGRPARERPGRRARRRSLRPIPVISR